MTGTIFETPGRGRTIWRLEIGEHRGKPEPDKNTGDNPARQNG